MLYKVTKKFALSSAEIPVGSYKTIEEAKKIINEKLAQDAIQKVNATYCLYEFFDLLEEFDQRTLAAPEEEQGGSSSQGQSQGSRPTPFNTSLQPKGLPRSWGTSDDKDKNQDK